MDAGQLRATQRPLRERYETDPEAAATPVHARGSFADDGVTATVDTWAGPVRAGLHPATGGDGSDACSGDMLLDAVGACAGVTLRSVATARGVEIRDCTFEVTGSFDARGTLGMSREVPVGVTDVVVSFDLDTDAEDAVLDKLAQATERYCVVSRSLAEPARIEVRRRGA